ncbi:hypothetical protein E8E12_007364 [Didymella heteroderae]|uniref:SWIM-type domain-containing protein n=1 Tax=Didymella heteroderae TaxID=1769908 RepID=A0A9P4WTX7_9PLEO|nr:hypothetical protein E8E12_007364 [Didymella heteroderae]
MSMSTLPSHRAFVTQLFNSLPAFREHDVSAASSPFSNAPEVVKKQLLSLQVLFSNEYLPALDLLDRKLVTRFLISVEEPLITSNETPNTAHNTTASVPAVQAQDSEPSNAVLNDIIRQLPQATVDTVHYVRSAQQRSSRFSTSYDSNIAYEVRLSAWNCTCPAFAFAAFPAVHPEPPLSTFTPRPISSLNRDSQEEDVRTEDRGTAEWMFGGVSLGQDMPPICKHLLACVLAERCGSVFGEYVEEKRVSVEIAAGWAAGWGDS